jgi:hypothetical protein
MVWCGALGKGDLTPAHSRLGVGEYLAEVPCLDELLFDHPTYNGTAPAHSHQEDVTSEEGLIVALHSTNVNIFLAFS